MRSGIRGLLTGSLVLVALHTLVATGASGRVAGLLRVPGRIAVRFLDPTVPAIPERAAAGGEAPAAQARPSTARYPDPFRTGAPSSTASGGD